MYKIIKLALFGAVALLATACNNTSKPRVFDGGAKLYINVKDNLRSMEVEARALEPIEDDTQKVLTPREVVEQSANFIFTREDGTPNVRVGITESEMKDPENARIKMREDMIVDRFGKLVSYFMNAKDVRIEAGDASIIAYIPQATIKEAWAKIQEAYNAEDYDKVYELFQTAYTAIPCTTKQWEALKAKGLQ